MGARPECLLQAIRMRIHGILKVSRGTGNRHPHSCSHHGHDSRDNMGQVVQNRQERLRTGHQHSAPVTQDSNKEGLRIKCEGNTPRGRG